ncbi:hypothetical protein DCS_02309 [Drechmeria coniospora]|uniref:Cyclin-dependent protein kinase regulator pho80 n=1 Tax=Drechmeria coniospora TaxID=98403 RepID=A0A151GVP6_DRECN|nr:hypothetical protein DCS_02309 [Drechmeria coniospora]KYK61168.1 hypothetical protein DCS_02309 [Drechmeria coniospora]ODA80934.1 hypothetical protein RJ55_03894 [Drechmeria coniospora]
MRLNPLALALAAAACVHAGPRTADVYIQPITPSSPPPPPSQLAEISYDLDALSLASVLAYEAPDIPDSASLVRIGVYDANAKQWTSGTTAASVDNFSKGYSPNILLSVDSTGDVLSVSCKGVQIDAGQTRDFGPKAIVLTQERGAQPTLNKPVVLSPEGKKMEPEQEKTFLQKYWWMIAIAVFIALSGGGSEK